MYNTGQSFARIFRYRRRRSLGDSNGLVERKGPNGNGVVHDAKSRPLTLARVVPVFYCIYTRNFPPHELICVFVMPCDAWLS